MCLAALLAVAPGCDFVFRLEPASLPRDGGGSIDDANDGGGSGDAPPGTTAYISAGDYDGDSIANAVDPCPLDPTIDTADGDSDGLPDACDPDLNGTETKDCIVLLETFEGIVDPRWKGTAGWVANCESDTAYCSPRAPSFSYLYFDQPYSVAQVRTELRLRNVATPAKDNGFQTFATLTPSGGDVTGASCGWTKTSALSEPRIQIRLNSTTTFESSSSTGAFVEGGDVTLSWTPKSLTSSSSLCRRVGAPNVDVTSTLPILDTGRYVGLRNQDLDLNVHYVVAYGSTCPQ